MKDMRAVVFIPYLLCMVLFAGNSAGADIEAGKRKAEACVGCHGQNGNSTNGMFPILAGQTARYIYLQLRDFKEERRTDPNMSPIVANLSREDMQDLAEYFSSQKPTNNNFKLDPQRVSLGAKKSDEVLCAMCHLGQLKGQNEIPRLVGQHPEYVLKQLKAFKNKTRTNDGGNMASVTRTLSDEDMINLSQYIGSLF